MKRCHHRLIYVFSLILAVAPISNCSGPPKQNLANGELPIGEDEQVPEDNQAVALTRERLIRRVFLDLRHQLPSIKDLEMTDETSFSFHSLIDQSFASDETSEVVSQLLEKAWQLNQQHPGLAEWIKAREPETDVSTINRFHGDILKEPRWFLRLSLQEGKAWSELFSGGLVINTPEVLDLWQLKGDFYPFADSQLMASDRLQQDLSLGLLVLPGFQWHLRRDNGRYSAAHHFLKNFACHSFEFEDAHLFKDIDPNILRDGVRLRNHTSKSPSCAGCHNHLETMGALLNQQSLIRQKHSAFDSPPFTFPFAFAGHQIHSYEDMAATLGQDPRIQLCTIKNIWEELTQRPFQASVDFTALHLAQQELENEGSNNLAAIVKRLLHAPAYGYDPEDGKTKEKTDRLPYNLRFLHQGQYEKVFRSLLRDNMPLSIHANLNPGQEELGGRNFQTPSGEYFYELQKLAQGVAQRIVTHELVNSSERVLLTLLTDSYPDGNSTELVVQQIIVLWQTLTSEKLQPTSLQLQKLHQLWLEVYESGSGDHKEKSHRAWTDLLTAVFLSPEFFTY